MAPTTKPRCEKSKTTTTRRTRIVTRSIYKKQQQNMKIMKMNQEKSSKMVEYSSFEDEPSSTTMSNINDSCSTPKSEKYKIPEILTCPPAPKKARVNNSCLVQRRRPINFFAHPDLDKFFMFAMRDHIKV